MSNPRDLERLARNVNPGAWAIEGERPLATLLGSCVAVCLWDPTLRIGGLNHFMLPRHEKSANRDLDVLLCGNYCMEALLNGMIGRGARKQRLQGKAFGGGNVISSLSGISIGERNAEFACEWLAREGISLLASDLMGPWSRKVVLDPQTGDVFCKRGQTSQSIVEAERSYARTLVVAPKKTDIELF
ncbi:chemotaxis protein CheD [Accumulibacter sp.]|uniref:chemotaxis protein CheD n=1 Tax=Accumulibacter sp. TaxID=2053492 RepID=UPI001599D682|nr:MAG: chemotaxis protein CheD [Candidatus Accumulibacter similis]